MVMRKVMVMEGALKNYYKEYLVVMNVLVKILPIKYHYYRRLVGRGGV